MLSVVIRDFLADRALKTGELVDTSGWRLERQLREQRFIRPATEDEIAEFRKAAGQKQQTAAAALPRKAAKPVKAAAKSAPVARKTAAKARSAR